MSDDEAEGDEEGFSNAGDDAFVGEEGDDKVDFSLGGGNSVSSQNSLCLL